MSLIENILTKLDNKKNIETTPSTDFLYDKIANPEKLNSTLIKKFSKSDKEDKSENIEKKISSPKSPKEEKEEKEKEEEEKSDNGEASDNKLFDDFMAAENKQEEKKKSEKEEEKEEKEEIVENIPLKEDTPKKYDTPKNEYSEKKQSASFVSNTNQRTNGGYFNKDLHREEAHKYFTNKDKDRYEGFDSAEELEMKKLELLYKILDLSKKGIKFSKSYSMADSYKVMLYEYKLHWEINQKTQGKNMIGSLVFSGCQILEFMNQKFDPFGADLKGWSLDVKDKIDNNTMDDNFGDLYDIYLKDKGGVRPEIALLFTLVTSAAYYSTTKGMLGKFESSINAESILNKIKLQQAQQAQQQQAQQQSSVSSQQMYHQYQNIPPQQNTQYQSYFQNQQFQQQPQQTQQPQQKKTQVLEPSKLQKPLVSEHDEISKKINKQNLKETK